MEQDARKREERMEYWGITPVSSLAYFGALLGIMGMSLIYIYSYSIYYVALCIAGLVCIGMAISINFNNDLSIRYRKGNIAYHIWYFCIILPASIILILYKTESISIDLALILLFILIVMSTLSLIGIFYWFFIKKA